MLPSSFSPILLICGDAPRLAAQTSGATLTGRVVDQTGAGVPGANGDGRGPSTGLLAPRGHRGRRLYSIAIAAGRHLRSLRDHAFGFKTAERKQVELNVASTLRLDVTLEVAGVEAAVSVTAVTPIVPTEVAVPGTIVSQRELENLPAQRTAGLRNLAVLAPGTSLGYNADPTKPGQLVVALNGGNGRNVNYIVDGGDNTDDTIGGALQNFSIENVPAFQDSKRRNSRPQYGRSSGRSADRCDQDRHQRLHGSVFASRPQRQLEFNHRNRKNRSSGTKAGLLARSSTGGRRLGGRTHRGQQGPFFSEAYEGTRQETKYTRRLPAAAAARRDGRGRSLSEITLLRSESDRPNVSRSSSCKRASATRRTPQKYGASAAHGARLPWARPSRTQYLSGLVGLPRSWSAER